MKRRRMAVVKISASAGIALPMTIAQQHLSKSAVAHEALENAFADELRQQTPAANWVERWRGVLRSQESAAADDARVSHLLNKHLH